MDDWRERSLDVWMELIEAADVSPEERASIKATQARMNECDRARWKKYGPQVEEQDEEMRRRGDLKVLAYLQEQRRAFEEEFVSMLWDDDTGRVRPEAYLALRLIRDSLAEQVESLRADPNVTWETAVEIVERIEAEGSERRFGEYSADEEGYYAYGPEDLPYLRWQAIRLRKQEARLKARLIAAVTVLSSYEMRGERPNREGDLLSEAPPGLSDRDLDFYSAVYRLRRETFDGPKAYAEAIADLCPKGDGNTVTYQAALQWLERRGHKKRAYEPLESFRPRAEAAAERVFARLQERANGQSVSSKVQ